MPPNLEDETALLRAVIRTIDKKVAYSLSLQEGEPPAVAVTLVLRKHKTTVVVPVEHIHAAASDAMRRSQLRATLKRAIDTATFEPQPIAKTKMLRGTVVEGGFFRVQQGGRGRR